MVFSDTSQFLVKRGGIMFKFAIKGGEEIFEDDEGAMKVAGHDLNGLMAYLSAIETLPSRLLHVPLMALVDYRGYRLVAVCTLPISRDTICYGSCDAGVTVHAKYPECNEAMRLVAASMNIMGHRVGTSDHVIYGPGDIECHLGTDGKFYVIDFSRFMPCQPVDKTSARGSFLHKLLRPELVSMSPVPLSPDAYSSMQREGGVECRRAVQQCYAMLENQLASFVVDFSRSDDDFFSPKMSSAALSRKEHDVQLHLSMLETLEQDLHARGINIRCLGRLRAMMPADNLPRSKCNVLRVLIIAECLARVWKSQLRHLWRDTMEGERLPADEPFRRVTAQFLNLLCAVNTPYWQTDLRAMLQAKFPLLLSPEEMAEGNLFQLVADVFPTAVLRLCSFVNITLREGMISSSTAGLAKAVADNQLDSFEVSMAFFSSLSFFPDPASNSLCRPQVYCERHCVHGLSYQAPQRC